MGNCSELYTFKSRSATASRIRIEVLHSAVRFYSRTVGPDFLFLGDIDGQRHSQVPGDGRHFLYRVAGVFPELIPIESLYDALRLDLFARIPSPASLRVENCTNGEMASLSICAA